MHDMASKHLGEKLWQKVLYMNGNRRNRNFTRNAADTQESKNVQDRFARPAS